jgi:hypothetical protein
MLNLKSKIFDIKVVSAVFLNPQKERVAVWGVGYMPDSGEDEFTPEYELGRTNANMGLLPFGYELTSEHYAHEVGSPLNFKDTGLIAYDNIPVFEMRLNDRQ